MTAKFNPLFNGEESFKQGYNTLVNGHVDQYDEILAVYPFGSEEQAQAVVPQMDRAIEKSVKVIREHSMSFRGEQKNPYVIDAYLLLAKATYFKQEYFKSLEGFNHVIQRFERTEQGREARLWAGRASTRVGNEFAARNQFEELEGQYDLPDRMRPHVYASIADLEITLENWEAAANYLLQALESDPPKEYRVRWRFILGQLYEKQNLRFEASEAFAKVVRERPNKYEFLIVAKLRRALNFDVYQGDVQEVYDDLDDLAGDAKNEEFVDQIYYIKALLAIEDENIPLAEESLRKSIRASTQNREQAGLSYAKLAEINFKFRAYVPSQAYYDSAYQALPKTHKIYPEVENYRSSLGQLVDQIKIIELNDSLIELAGMSPSQQRAVFEDYIARLKEEEERAAERERNRALNQALASESAALGGGPQAGLGGGWYFYNSTTRASGIRDFSQNWGRRDLTDNWRRSAAAPIGGALISNESESGSGEEEGGETGESSGPSGEEKYNVEAYLAQIPRDQATIEQMHDENQDAYLRMAGIYKEDIGDLIESKRTYETLIRRYPDGKYVALSLYALHLFYTENGETAKAEEKANQILNEHPTSRFAMQLRGDSPAGNEELTRAKEAYNTAYSSYTQNRFAQAKSQLEAGLTQFGTTAIAPKMQLLLAMVLAKTEGPEPYKNKLQYVADTYSGTNEAERASELLMYIENANQAANAPESPFTVDPRSPHRAIVVVPNENSNINNMKNEMAIFNRDFNRLQNLSIRNIFLDRDRQIIVVSGFINQTDAVDYVDRLVRHPGFSPLYSSELMRIFAISDANYQTFYREKDVDEYMTFYDQIREQ